MALPLELSCITQELVEYLNSVKKDGCFLQPVTIADADLVEKYVEEMGSQLVESVIVGDKFWYFITQVDVYLKDNPFFDDCSQARRIQRCSRPQPILMQKNHKDKYWTELSIWWGDIEAHVIGAFWGRRRSTEKWASLGPSMAFPASQKFEGDNNLKLYLATNVVSNTRTFRLLRDYTKAAAMKRWSFASTFYYSKGFFPAHPLMYANHPSRAYSRVPTLDCVASNVIASYTSRRSATDHVQSMMNMLQKCTSLRIIWEKSSRNIRSFRDLQEEVVRQRIKVTSYATNTIRLLRILEDNIQYDQQYDMLTAATDAKEDLLCLMTSLMKAVQTVNENISKSFF